MSLADSIGMCLVLFVAALVFVWIGIEARWRFAKLYDRRKAETLQQRRELGLLAQDAGPMEHLLVALPYNGFDHDIEYPRDEAMRKSMAAFLDAQYKVGRWEFVAFIADEAIVFRRPKETIKLADIQRSARAFQPLHADVGPL